MQYDLIVVGGGAAGFFCAIQSAIQNPSLKILILEKSAQVLGKVKISGGGRCNVTHACFEPKEMALNYPRGHKELLGPFHQFLCGDMMAWLEEHGVATKIEEDGRVFPISDSSQTIIDCFLKLCQQHHIKIQIKFGVTEIAQSGETWEVIGKEKSFKTKKLLIATGSSAAIWKMLQKIGYQLIDPVPSLFTFNSKNSLLKNLPGVSVPQSIVNINQTRFNETGPLLITHWGLSGPAILKLSAWAARELFEKKYQFEITVNWSGLPKEKILESLEIHRKKNGKKQVSNLPLAGLPKRLWLRMLQLCSIPNAINYASLNSKQIEKLVNIICQCIIEVNGKSTFKDEFVTAGGVGCKQINFKTMQSKLHSNLYFAGEVLNIDAVTGGYNFQAAWTTAYLAAKDIAKF